MEQFVREDQMDGIKLVDIERMLEALRAKAAARYRYRYPNDVDGLRAYLQRLTISKKATFESTVTDNEYEGVEVTPSVIVGRHARVFITATDPLGKTNPVVVSFVTFKSRGEE